MNLLNDSFYYLYWIYLALAPVIVFFIFPKVQPPLQPLSLLIAICILPFFAAFFPHAPFRNSECWLYSFYFFALFFLVSTIYVGSLELIRRAFSKQLSMQIKENLKYGVISNLSILVFLVFGIYFALILIGCKYCGIVVLSGIFSVGEFVYSNVVPLVC